MKKCLGAVFFLFCGLCFSENIPPRIAVVQFITNDDVFFKEFIKPIFEHTIQIREMVYESIARAEAYEVISNEDIDAFFREQNIPVRLFAGRENIEKYKLLQVDYLVTGTVAVYTYPPKGGMNSCVSLNLFDVANNRYIYRDYQYFAERSNFPYSMVIALVNRFTAAISNGVILERIDRPYKAGDIGPAGGMICYDKGEYSDGWRYIERAPPESEFMAFWGPYGVDIPGTGTDIGQGKENTVILAKYLSGLGESGAAAQLCNELECNGYDDWFLPSKDELVWVTLFLERSSDPIRRRAWYWSSSQSSNKFAWVKLNGDHRGIYAKNYTIAVRAVRYF
jgi:hypothetical protein